MEIRSLSPDFGSTLPAFHEWP